MLISNIIITYIKYLNNFSKKYIGIISIILEWIKKFMIEEKELEKIISLFNLEKYDQVITLAKRFTKNYPDNLHGKNALALSLKAIKKYDDSKTIFLEIINKNIKNNSVAYIYSNAGNLFYEIGQAENAANLYKTALELDRKNISSYLGLALVYSNEGNNNKAIEILLEGIKFDPSNNNLNYNLANSLRRVERYKEAAYHYSLTSNRLSKSYQLECLYLSTKKESTQEVFCNFLYDLNKRNINDPLIASISNHYSIRYNEVNNCNFCKLPFEFIKKESLFEESNFNKEFINQLLMDITNSKISKRTQSLLKEGVQSSGNLFNLELDSIQELKKIILKKVEQYRNFYSSSNEDFIKKWPKKFNLYGWIILMDSGGNLLPHIHKEGWLSSSIYLTRPFKKENNEGDIGFTMHGGNYPSDNTIYPEKIINIEEGDIVMFPSSIFHYTVPFNSDQKRITLAFDLIPIG